jgi:uncharacterized RDD family membrane protein YckC
MSSAPDSASRGPISAWATLDALTLTARPPALEDDGIRAGQVVAGHRLLRPLGRGGFGSVWEGESVDGGRRAALKFLLGARLLSESVRARFQREARLAGALSHPHCVFVLGVDEQDGVPVIVYELAPGGTLQDRLARSGPLPWAEAVDAALDVAAGLEAALAQGFLHRDVKPSNCFVDERGRVKVGDFGLSRPVAESDAQLTAAGAYLGTPAYSSPEQVRGQELDARSDQFALGTTLYALLTGRLPFAAPTVSAVLARIVSEDPDPFPGHLDVPPGLERVVRRTLARDRGRRYESYAALRSALLPYSGRAVGPALVPHRIGAALVDAACVLLAILPLSLLVSLAPPRWEELLEMTVAWLTWVLLATLTERSGGSPGARLLGLRVVRSDGADARWAALALRSALFAGVVVVVPSAVPAPPGAFPGELLVLGAGLAALFATARTHNGWAGLHELASGTRVVAVAPGMPAASGRVDTTLPPTGEPYGDLVTCASLWRDEQEEVLVGWDPALERRVFIHRHAAARAPRAALRWLQAGADARGAWDVYEHVSGYALADRVATHGPLPWSELGPLLASLASQRDEGTAGSALQVWIEPSGMARLMPFRVVKPGPGEDAHVVRGSLLLRQVAVLAITGRLLAASDVATATAPQVPEEAFDMVQALWADAGPASPPAPTVGAPLQRRVRLRAVALTAAALVMLSLVATLGISLLVHPSVRMADTALEVLPAWREGRDDATAPAQAAEDVLLEAERASALILARPSSLWPVDLAARDAAQGLQAALTAEDRTWLEDARSRRPSSAAGARSALDMLAGPAPTFPQVVLTSVMFALSVGSIPALVLAAWLRGGLSLTLAAISVRRRGGRTASRLRCLGRAAVVWSPGLVLLLPIPDVPRFALGALLTALFLAGAFLAVVRPRRGVQDVLAGTVLVPR